MDRRGNFSAGVPNRMPINFQRPVSNLPPKPQNTIPVSSSNTIYYLIGGLSIFVLIIIGVIFLFSSGEKNELPVSPVHSEDLQEKVVPEITSGGCEKLGLLINNKKEYTCLDNETKFLKVYTSRDLQNVILKRVNFKIFSGDISLNYSSDYGLAPGSFYVYQIGFNGSSVDKLEVYPVVQDDGGEKECQMSYVENIQPCVTEEISVESALEYTFDENMNVIVTTKNETTNQTGEILDVFADKPKKKILNFSIDSVFGEIDELKHNIYVRFDDNRSILSLSPIVQISPNATLSPVSGASRDFSNPVIYTVTSSDGSTQNYTIYVSVLETEEIPIVLDTNVPVITLYPIESSESINRTIKFKVSDEGNISQCMFYSGENVQSSLVNINKTVNNTIFVSNLAVGFYSYIIKCNDSVGNLGVSNTVTFRVHAINVPVPVDGLCGSANRSYIMNDSGFGLDSFCSAGSVSSVPVFPPRKSTSSWQCLGSSGGNNASCSAKRVIITNISGLVAGEWNRAGNALALAELMAKLNKNYYIINVGALSGCPLCKSAEENVFSKQEFKQWAYENGIAMVYSDDDNYDTDPIGKIVRARYLSTIFALDKYPIIILVGYESNSAIAAFVYRIGYTINGIVNNLTPSNFIQIADSYTHGYN